MDLKCYLQTITSNGLEKVLLSKAVLTWVTNGSLRFSWQSTLSPKAQLAIVSITNAPTNLQVNSTIENVASAISNILI